MMVDAVLKLARSYELSRSGQETKHSRTSEIIVEFLPRTVCAFAIARARETLDVLGGISDLGHRVEQVVRPQKRQVDRYARAGPSLLGVHHGPRTGTDLRGNVLDGEIAAQSGRTQVGAPKSKGLLDGIGRSAEKGVLT